MQYISTNKFNDLNILLKVEIMIYGLHKKIHDGDVP